MTNYYANYGKRYDSYDLAKRNANFAQRVRDFYSKTVGSILTEEALQYMSAEDLELFKEGSKILDESVELMSENARLLARIGNIENKVDRILNKIETLERRGDF